MARYVVNASMICQLITVDERQAKAASASGATLKAITDFSPP